MQEDQFPKGLFFGELNQRKGVGGTFTVNGKTIHQNQVYKNFKFDSNGNQTFVTYGDNILQKTTWHVQP